MMTLLQARIVTNKVLSPKSQISGKDRLVEPLSAGNCPVGWLVRLQPTFSLHTVMLALFNLLVLFCQARPGYCSKAPLDKARGEGTENAQASTGEGGYGSSQGSPKCRYPRAPKG